MAQGEKPCRQVWAGLGILAEQPWYKGRHSALPKSHCSAGGWHSCSGHRECVGDKSSPDMISDIWPPDSFRELGIQQQTRQAGMASQ